MNFVYSKYNTWYLVELFFFENQYIEPTWYYIFISKYGFDESNFYSLFSSSFISLHMNYWYKIKLKTQKYIKILIKKYFKLIIVTTHQYLNLSYLFHHSTKYVIWYINNISTQYYINRFLITTLCPSQIRRRSKFVPDSNSPGTIRRTKHHY